MKNFLKQWLTLAIVLTILSAPQLGNGALVQLSSNSGEIRDLLQIDAQTLYAATQGGGIYKSTDGGTTWSRLSGISEPYVWRLAGHSANTQLIYAATRSGLYKSMDGGANWSQITFDNVRAVAVDPFDLNHLLIGVPGAGIYVTSDGGNSFSLSNAGLDSLDVTTIAFDPIHQGVVYAGLNSNLNGGWGGVFKSTNGGGSWVNWNNPNNNGALGNKFVTTLVVDNDSNVHAGTSSPQNLGGLYRQTGTGAWSSGVEVYGVETIAVDKNWSTTHRLWAGTRFFGPFVSKNKGSNWEQAVNPTEYPEVYSSVYSVMTFLGNPEKVLIGVNGLGLYQTLNGDSNWPDWVATGDGIKADRARAIVAYPPANPTTFYMGLAGGGVMRSQNGGPWTDFNTGLEGSGLMVSQLAVSTTNANNIYTSTYGSGLFKWNGSTWAKVVETELPYYPNAFIKPMGLIVDPVNDSNVFYSLFDYGIYKRDLSGTWSMILSQPTAFKIIMSPSDHLRLYALVFGDRPYESVDGGVNWTQVNVTPVPPGFDYIAFFAVAENPLDTNFLLASTNKGLYNSTDGGNNWTEVNPILGLGSTVQTGLVFSPTANGRVWAVDRSGGYYCSNDFGATWTARSDPLLGAPIVDLRLINGALYLITDGSGILMDAVPTCP